MIECIGIQEKKGTFVPDGKTESVSFDNVMIYYITDDNPDIVGYFGKELKCKNSKVRKINFNEWSEIIGKEIIFHYNIFGANPGARRCSDRCRGQGDFVLVTPQ